MVNMKIKENLVPDQYSRTQHEIFENVIKKAF